MKKLNVNVNGNKKLRNTDKVRFLIWNLPAVQTCPFRTAMCESACYARKAERCYPSVLPSRERNYNESLSADFVENMIFTIESELNTKKYNGKLAIFRIHESGDFYSLEYARKWVAIARHFESDPRIRFLVYTKSLLYFVQLGCNFSDFPSNLVIRSSLWKDTSEYNLNLTREFDFPVYTALTASEMVTEKQNGHVFRVCRCDDCANCSMCWKSKVKDIICEIH